MKRVLVPIEQMTDAELEAEAQRQERAGDLVHASELRHYTKTRRVHDGPDVRAWPPEAFPARSIRPDLALKFTNAMNTHGENAGRKDKS